MATLRPPSSLTASSSPPSKKSASTASNTGLDSPIWPPPPALMDPIRNDVAHVAISRNPFAHFPRKVLYAAVRPASWQRSVSRAANLLQVARLNSDRPGTILSDLKRARIHKVEHHRAHLASAFFASPFEEAAVVSVDGFGDFTQRPLGRRPRQSARRARLRAASPIRSASSTPPSPSSWASPNTATSTR